MPTQRNQWAEGVPVMPMGAIFQSAFTPTHMWNGPGCKIFVWLNRDAVIAHLRGRFGHVSVERVLSGPGLVNLYQSLIAIDHLSAPPRKPSEITEAALRIRRAWWRIYRRRYCPAAQQVSDARAVRSEGAFPGLRRRHSVLGDHAPRFCLHWIAASRQSRGRAVIVN